MAARAPSLPLLALLLVPAAACRSLPDPVTPGASTSPLLERDEVTQEDQGEVEWRPEPTPKADWVRLGSGEWLRGEVDSFDGETLVFDSEVLEDLSIDWADVEELLTVRPFTVRLSDRSVIYGGLEVGAKRIWLEGPLGRFVVKRREVMRAVPGLPEEKNYWSGKVRAGLTARSGNTDQTDTTVYAEVKRETAATRLELSQDSVTGKLDGTKNVNNHTFKEKFDVYLTPRLYVTPLATELYNDEFQNIDLRATSFGGIGYDVVDRPSLEWHVDSGLGYRYTRYESVAAGEDDTDGTGILVVGTSLDSDLTSRIELEFDYSAEVGLEESGDTNQTLEILLSMEFLWDLDFDTRVVWKRVGNPEPDENGVTPERDDFRLEVGLSWEF